jgi:hypothetical protein
MIDAMTKQLIRRLRANQEDGDPDRDRKWAFLSDRTDFQEVAA